MEDRYLNVRALEWNRENQKQKRICIIAIIKEEAAEIIKAFRMKVKQGSYMYWEGFFGEDTNTIIHCYQQNESGNIHSSILTQYVLNEEYDYYFCIGTAGAVGANLYDVIIANQIIYLEKGANTKEGRLYDGKAPEITEKEKNRINTFLTKLKVTKEFSFAIKASPVYSGENTEKDPDSEDLLLGKKIARHLAAIDMESFGVYESLSFYQSVEERFDKFITIIRGVSDKADGLKNLIYEDGLNEDERKERAIQNVIIVLKEFIFFLKEVN